MVSPAGDQFEISSAGYHAVITEGGAALRHLAYDGRPILDGFDAADFASGGRGQLLMPWPNRIEDGRYEFGGQSHQLALSEPDRRNASHGLARWAAWSLEEHTDVSVSLVLRIMAQKGYPWSLDLHVLYDLSPDGLTVTQTATNLAPSAAPYACGAHPYLTLGDGTLDDWELTLPAATRTESDPERLLPIGGVPVDGTAYDFRVSRPVKETVFNHAFGDLVRDDQQRATVRLASQVGAVSLWGDEQVNWFLLYSADDVPGSRRASLAIEPMTAQANAFRSGEDLIVLAPAGHQGDSHSMSWGVYAE